MKLYKKSILISCLGLFATNAYAFDSDGRLYAKIYTGRSFLSEDDFDQVGLATIGAKATNEGTTGSIAGAAIGYYVTSAISMEVAWDHRSNDVDKVLFSDGLEFNQGEYETNIFFLNGYYHFGRLGNNAIHPHIGAGIGYVNKNELTLSGNGTDYSYSQDSDDTQLAYQLIAGVAFEVFANLSLNLDARYTKLYSVDFNSDTDSGTITGLDYDPFSVTVGASIKF